LTDGYTNEFNNLVVLVVIRVTSSIW